MSYTFSRRAFLKYSAATAVAVAGADELGVSIYKINWKKQRRAIRCGFCV